ncbi:hypothetical protein ACIQU6_27950 [Streptomyces sp. NPDC090442]|uniref:hypothetical protein n=1 Tax=Streptomyces sp. NPDC090442 TaxID=3365962 RepID=UPI003817F01C
MPASPAANRKSPTPAHRRALLAALAEDKGRVPAGTNSRVKDAMHLAHWVTEVTNTGRAAAGARWAGYDGPTFLSINSRGRRALLNDAGRTALREAGPGGRLPEGTPRRITRTLHRDGLIEYRNPNGTVHSTEGDDGVRGPLYVPHVTELGRRLVSGFPQVQRIV